MARLRQRSNRLGAASHRMGTRLSVESLEARKLLSADGVAPAGLPGDLDLNGHVDFADFLQLSANFGATDASPEMGDIDNDSTVGFADFLALSQNFGTSIEAADSPGTEPGDTGSGREIDVLVNDQNDIVISSAKGIEAIAYAVGGKLTKIEDIHANEYTLSVLNVTDIWVKTAGEAAGENVWEHFVCPTDEIHAETLAKIDVTVDDDNQIVVNSSETIHEIVYFVDGVATRIEDIHDTEYTFYQLNVTDLWVRAGDAENGRDYWEHFICPTDEGHVAPDAHATVPAAHIDVLVNDQNDIVISSSEKIVEIVYLVDGQVTTIPDVHAKEYTLSVLNVTDIWVKTAGDSGGRDVWEHFVCPTDEVHGETLAKIDVTVDDDNQIVVKSSETIHEIVYFVDGVATRIEDIHDTEYTFYQLNVTDLWVRAGDAENGRDYWEHFICPTDEGHVAPDAHATVPAAHIDVLVNDQNDIVISSSEKIVEIVYLVDGQVTTIPDVHAKEYTLSVLNVTDIWVKTAGDSGGRDVWEHFVCPTDEVHAETLAKIDVTVDHDDQIMVNSSETIHEIVYFVDGVATRIEDIHDTEYTFYQLNVTDLWVRAGDAENGRDYWEHFICPTDEGHVAPDAHATVPAAHIDVLVNDQNDIVISSSEKILEIVYLVDGQVTTIPEVHAKEYTLSVLNVTDIWVKTAGDSGGRDVWEHFVCPTDEVHGETDGLGDIEIVVDDLNQIVISSDQEISEIVYVVDGMITKIEDIDAKGYTLAVLGVTDIWIRSGKDDSGRDLWQHFICPTDH